MAIWNFVKEVFSYPVQLMSQFEWLGYNLLQWGLYVFLGSAVIRFVLFPFFSGGAGVMAARSARVARDNQPRPVQRRINTYYSDYRGMKR